MKRKHVGDEHLDVAIMMTDLALALHDKGEYNEAEQKYRDSLAMTRTLLGEEHFYVADGMANLGRVLFDKGDRDGAEPYFNDSYGLCRKLGEEKSSVADDCLQYQALTLIARNDPAGAEKPARQALAIPRETSPENQFKIANGKSVLGATIAGQHRLQEAEPLLLEGYQDLLDAPGTRRSKSIERARRRLIDLYEAWGKPEQAARYRMLQP